MRKVGEQLAILTDPLEAGNSLLNELQLRHQKTSPGDILQIPAKRMERDVGGAACLWKHKYLFSLRKTCS